MFVKLAVIACAVSASLAQYQPQQQAYNGPLAGGQPASLYPAGVDPQSCPNFPHCSNPLVAVGRDASQLSANYPQIQQPAQQQYQVQPQYQPQPQQYQAQYQPQPQAYQPQYAPAQQQSQYSPDIQQRLDKGEYIGDGDYHGEGLAESLAPEAQQPAVPQYQAYQQPAIQQYAQPAAYQQPAAPQYQQPAAQLPAGVSRESCPNYPLCH